MEQEALKSVLESLLFVSSKPLKIKELSSLLELEPAQVKSAMDLLVESRKDSGVVVLENSGEYQLATSAQNSPVVKKFLNAELREKLTDATVEVLAIIAYRQPISKAEIEAIRGVNSQYSIRNLLMRGLVEKIPNPHDARSVVYQTTTEFLMHMGLGSVSELPEFEKLVEQIKLPQVPQVQQEEQMAAMEAAQPEQGESEQQTESPAMETISEVAELVSEELPAAPEQSMDAAVPQTETVLEVVEFTAETPPAQAEDQLPKQQPPAEEPAQDGDFGDEDDFDDDDEEDEEKDEKQPETTV